MKWFRRLWRWFRGWFERPLRTVFVEEVPERLKRGEAYVVGEDEHYWCVALLCPCGCGDTIQLSLIERSRPRWTYQIESGGELTLSPSVWRTTGCRSHFFLRRGRVVHAGQAAFRTGRQRIR